MNGKVANSIEFKGVQTKIFKNPLNALLNLLNVVDM